MEYRREIDGLRAIAILPVLLFHAKFTAFTGGFVGVDVFFVISGYLITRMILVDRENDAFSLLKFYERRARRILPALFFVMLCCIPFAWMWMPPLQFEDFAESIVAVSTFSSNILFLHESGNYFGGDAAEKPLLHTWSLAVEEQYYLLFPIFLMLIWGFGRRLMFHSIVAVVVLSFAYCEWGSRTEPDDTFYLLPTRAWELLAGSTCAFLRPGRSNALSALGLGLIVLSILAYDERTPFPSIYALAPVIGTSLVILYGASTTLTAQVLSTPILVGIGLISYSAYLWHQPLFAFARLRSVGEPSAALMSSLVVASLALAYLSFRFVERPFRRKERKLFPTTPRLLAAAVVGMSIFIALGGFWMNEARNGRFKFADIEYDDHVINMKRERAASWQLFLENPKYSVSLKSFAATAGATVKIIVAGDSHSKDLFNALFSNQTLFPGMEFRWLEVNFKCSDKYPPFADIESIYAKCAEEFHASHKTLLESADWILFSARWKAGKEEKLPAYIRVARANGLKVAVTGNTAEFDPESPSIFGRIFHLLPRARINKKLLDAEFYKAMDERVLTINATIKAIVAREGDIYLEKFDFECDLSRKSCDGADEMLHPLHFDYGHYTVTGATYFGKAIADKQWLASLGE